MPYGYVLGRIPYGLGGGKGVGPQPGPCMGCMGAKTEVVCASWGPSFHAYNVKLNVWPEHSLASMQHTAAVLAVALAGNGTRLDWWLPIGAFDTRVVLHTSMALPLPSFTEGASSFFVWALCAATL